ncbi:MAG: DUF4252 domain-containing protein [Cyclobacteriaceae bacterium]|nr:DUF4252 domain-containing protein [Cyclobacteriaceae bacterium]
MKNTVLFAACLGVALQLSAQTKTTENLQQRYTGSFSLYFYQNTLRMLNQTENKEFDELIKDIEKMKFLMIEKDAQFNAAQYSKLKKEYIAESFEEVMTTRVEGRSFDVLLKEKSDRIKGVVVLVNDSASLYVLDMVGSIALNKIPDLYKAIDDSTDVGKRIKSFTDRNAKRKGNDKDGDDHD